MDHTRALKVFCAVADAQGLAGAARKLSLSPPTVTRIINELESYLGTTLLHRTTRTVKLTEVGANYLADARDILEEIKTADDAARGAHQTPTGTLRVTASVLFGQYYIAPLVREFLDAYPEVKFDGLFTDRLVNIVDEGFDIAVRIGPLPDSNLRAIRVGAVRHVVCGSPEYFEKHGIPETPDELDQHNIIFFSGINSDRNWEFDDKISVPLKPRLSYTSITPCIDSAKSGWGVTRALSYQLGPALAEGSIQTVLTDHSTNEWPIHLVHAHGRTQSAKVRCFLDLAAKRLRDNSYLK